MNEKVKKIASYILIGIVVVVTLISILSIWDLISLERVFWKASQSLFVVFIAAVVILFISSVVLNNSDRRKDL